MMKVCLHKITCKTVPWFIALIHKLKPVLCLSPAITPGFASSSVAGQTMTLRSNEKRKSLLHCWWRSIQGKTRITLLAQHKHSKQKHLHLCEKSLGELRFFRTLMAKCQQQANLCIMLVVSPLARLRIQDHTTLEVLHVIS